MQVIRQGPVGKDKPKQGGVDLINGNTRHDSYGTPLVSLVNGTIQYFDSGDKQNSYGFYAKIKFEKDGVAYEMIYAHMVRPSNSVELINQGIKQIKAGEVVGSMGNTGDCRSRVGGKYASSQFINEEERKDKWGTHLHWEIRKYNTDTKAYDQFDPMTFKF